MTDCISIGIRQERIQISIACWELYRLEHGVQPYRQMPSNKMVWGGNDAFQQKFKEIGAGCAVVLETEQKMTEWMDEITAIMIERRKE